ncbi:MAG: hypothetical protein ACFFCS_28140 [Candidatus Hodarchaeota archaeon]
MSEIQAFLSEKLASYYFSQLAEERRVSYAFLGEIGKKIPIPGFRLQILKLLMKSLIDKDLNNKIHGIYYLGELGQFSTDISKHIIYPMVLFLLNPKLKKVLEFYILQALEKLDKNSSEVETLLFRGMSDVAYQEISRVYLQDPIERQSAIWKIGKLGTIYFPAIIDLIPILLQRLIDENDKVKSILVRVIMDLTSTNQFEMVHILLFNMETSDNIFIKERIIDLLHEIGRLNPSMINEIIPAIIRELENPNRRIHIKIHKLLKTFERIQPDIFIKYKLLLIDALKSKNRYAYHWAVKTFTSTYINYLKDMAKVDLSHFINENIEIIDLLIKNEHLNLLQTRVILMMMIHEAKEGLTRFSSNSSSINEGFVESLAIIQKSGLKTVTEVVAAYEKFKQILINLKNLYVQTN